MGILNRGCFYKRNRHVLYIEMRQSTMPLFDIQTKCIVFFLVEVSLKTSSLFTDENWNSHQAWLNKFKQETEKLPFQKLPVPIDCVIFFKCDTHKQNRKNYNPWYKIQDNDFAKHIFCQVIFKAFLFPGKYFLC